MAITAYDQPAQAQFMQTYVPMPFEELMQAGQMKQQRWDTNAAITQEAETQLGNLPALRQVVLPSGEVQEVGDYKHVEKKAQEYTNQIEQLVSSIGDKSSPEYRAQISGIISNLRKDMGQQGIFGRAASNVERYQALRKQIDEAEIGSKTHRAVGLTSQLGNYARRSQDEFMDLSVGAPILKDVDINKRLNETMSQINDVILADPELSNEYSGKITQRGYAEGISYDRAYNIARNLIMSDSDIISDLQARAIERGFDEEQLNQSVENLARNMANVYTKQSRNVSWSNDPLFMHNLKKSEEFQDQMFATSINLPYQSGKAVKNGEELDDLIGARQAQISELRIENTRFLKDQYGIPDEFIQVGQDGLITVNNTAVVTDPETGEPVEQSLDLGMDISSEIFRMNEEIRQAQKNFKDVNKLKQDAMQHADLNDKYMRSDKFQNTLQKARDKARNKAESIYANISSSDPVWMNQGITREEAIDQYTEDNYLDYVSEVDPRYKKYNEYLQSRAEEKGQQTNVVSMPPKVNEKMTTLLKGFVDDMPLEWADTEEGTGIIDKDEREDIDFTSKENEPMFLGFFYDQTSGNIKSMYRVYNKKGEGKTIKTEIPKGTTRYLYENNVFDEFNSLVFNDLYNQLNGVENSYSGTGTLSLPSGELDERGNPTNPINVNYLGRGSDGRWRVSIPTSDGEPKVLVFNEAGEVVKGLAAISKKSHENAINNR